jgi:hypothetical protein
MLGQPRYGGVVCVVLADLLAARAGCSGSAFGLDFLRAWRVAVAVFAVIGGKNRGLFWCVAWRFLVLSGKFEIRVIDA